MPDNRGPEAIEARLSAFDISIGSRYPRAGGYYRVVADCYHPTFAFMLNWSQTLMQGAGAAGVAFIGADYLMPVLLPPAWRTPHASLAIACATMLVLLAFLRVNPATQVQEVGLLFFGATMLVPAFLLGSFEKLLNYVIFTDTVTIAAVAGRALQNCQNYNPLQSLGAVTRQQICGL